MRSLTILLISLTLTACATSNYYAQALNSWRGNNLNTLFKSWGAPDQVVPIPNGNTYYVYNSQSVQSAPGAYTPSFFNTTSNGSGTPVSGMIMLQGPPSIYVLSCRTWFEVNTSNVIVDAGAKGNYCYAGNDSVQGIASPSFILPQPSS
jgi:hypothetical protein